MKIKASGLLILIGLSCFGIAGCDIVPEAVSQPNLKSHSENSAKLSTIKESVVWLTNNYRSHKGKDELFVNPRLSALARKHSEDMASGRVGFGHGGFNCRAQTAKLYLGVESIAENVAMNYGSKNPATTAMNGWKKSPGHNRSLLGNYSQIGVGVARNKQGKIYFTQLFAR